MASSRTSARALKSAGGGKVRSSRRRSSISAIGRFYRQKLQSTPDTPQCRQPRADLDREVAVRHGPEAEKRPVVLDGGRPVATLVGDDGEVVMGAGVPGIDFDGAAQELPRVGETASGLVHER